MHFSMAVFSKDLEDGEDLLYRYFEENEEYFVSEIEMSYKEALEGYIETLNHKIANTQFPQKDPKTEIEYRKRVTDAATILETLSMSKEKEMEEVKKYYGEENFDEDNNLIRRFNPYGRFDYASPGGRFSGLLKLKKGGVTDSAFGKDIKYIPDLEAAELAGAVYDYIIDGIAFPRHLQKKVDDMCSGPFSKKYILSSLKTGIEEQNNDKIEYIRSKMMPSTFGFISTDGEWHDMYDYIENRSVWKYIFTQQMEESIKNNYLITIYDCHE